MKKKQKEKVIKANIFGEGKKDKEIECNKERRNVMMEKVTMMKRCSIYLDGLVE